MSDNSEELEKEETEEYMPPKDEDQKENGGNYYIQEENAVPEENEHEAQAYSEQTAPVEEPYDYKESIRRLKREYKEDQKRRKELARQQRMSMKAERPAGAVPIIYVSIIASVATLLICCIVFALLAFFPNKDDSYLSYMINSRVKQTYSGKPSVPETDDVIIDGTKVGSGDTVIINVDAESIASAVYAKSARSVVGICVKQATGSKWESTLTDISQGSGVIYSEDGLIITNCHIINDAIDPETGDIASGFYIYVYFKTDLSEYYVVESILGYDIDTDIALLKVDVNGLTPITFGDSESLNIGDTVVAIGSPGGIEFMNSVSEGIISGIDRSITTSSNVVYDLLQTTAAINPGNSGGALLNKNGDLVGICIIKIVAEDYESMGFAFSSNMVKKIVESILKYGKYIRPMLGIVIDTTYDAKAAENNNWPVGLYIDSVDDNMDAKKAGIKAGDIVTYINGIRVTTFPAFRKQLLMCGIGDEVTLTVYRTDTGKTLDIKVKLSASSDIE